MAVGGRQQAAGSKQHAARYTANDLEDVGFTVPQIRQGGYTTEDILQSCGFTAEECHSAGFTCLELRKHLGLSAKELKEGGYSKKDIAAAGFHAQELTKLFN